MRKELWEISLDHTWDEPRLVAVLNSESTAEEVHRISSIYHHYHYNSNHNLLLQHQVRLTLVSLHRFAASAFPRGATWDLVSVQATSDALNTSLCSLSASLTQSITDPSTANARALLAPLLDLLRAVQTAATLLDNAVAAQKADESSKLTAGCVVRYLALQHALRDVPPSASVEAARTQAVSELRLTAEALVEPLVRAMAKEEQQRADAARKLMEQEASTEEERRRAESALIDEQLQEELRLLEEEQELAEEQRRIDDERREAEQQQLAEDRHRLADMQRRLDEERMEAQAEAERQRRLAEEAAKRAEDERKVAETQRKLNEERQAAAEVQRRLEEERRAAAAAQRKQAEEAKAAEAKRLAELQRQREEAEKRAIEDRRVAEAMRLIDEERQREEEAKRQAEASRAVTVVVSGSSAIKCVVSFFRSFSAFFFFNFYQE